MTADDLTAPFAFDVREPVLLPALLELLEAQVAQFEDAKADTHEHLEDGDVTPERMLVAAGVLLNEVGGGQAQPVHVKLGGALGPFPVPYDVRVPLRSDETVGEGSLGVTERREGADGGEYPVHGGRTVATAASRGDGGTLGGQPPDEVHRHGSRPALGSEMTMESQKVVEELPQVGLQGTFRVRGAPLHLEREKHRRPVGEAVVGVVRKGQEGAAGLLDEGGWGHDHGLHLIMR